ACREGSMSVLTGTTAGTGPNCSCLSALESAQTKPHCVVGTKASFSNHHPLAHLADQYVAEDTGDSIYLQEWLVKTNEGRARCSSLSTRSSQARQVVTFSIDRSCCCPKFDVAALLARRLKQKFET